MLKQAPEESDGGLLHSPSIMSLSLGKLSEPDFDHHIFETGLHHICLDSSNISRPALFLRERSRNYSSSPLLVNQSPTDGYCYFS